MIPVWRLQDNFCGVSSLSPSLHGFQDQIQAARLIWEIPLPGKPGKKKSEKM